MPRVEITVKDDNGAVISTQEVEIDVGSGSFHDIEGAVLDLRKQALPRLEHDLLTHQQDRFKAEKGGPSGATGGG